MGDSEYYANDRRSGRSFGFIFVSSKKGFRPASIRREGEEGRGKKSGREKSNTRGEQRSIFLKLSSSFHERKKKTSFLQYRRLPHSCPLLLLSQPG